MPLDCGSIKLFSIEFDEESQEKVFKIEIIKDGSPFLKRMNADELLLDKQKLNKLNKKEIEQIIFHSTREK